MKQTILLKCCIFALVLLSGCGSKKTDEPKPEPPPVVVKPVITSFAPLSAEAGTEITITGEQFGKDADLIDIRFGSSAVIHPKTVTATQLTVNVPGDATTGKITLTVGGKKAVSAQEFTVKPPVTNTLSITDFTPKSARPGSTVTITGTGFGNDASAVGVAFGLPPYDDPVSVTPTTIIIKTDLGTLSGKITVRVNGKEAVSKDDFTALPEELKVVSYYYSHRQLGHQMYVYAQGFGNDVNKIFFSFGGTKPVKANYLYGSSIGAIIPRYALPGKITVTVDGNTATGEENLKLDMSMREFTPKSAKVGDTIKITGVEFTDKDDMSIYFNSKYQYMARPIKVTPTEMWVVVPPYAITGQLEIRANLATIIDISDDKLTILK